MNPPEHDRPLEPGTVVARNYRVTSRLGAGGMGTVYLAENLTLNQRVVVKVLRGGQAGAGQEEAQMLANLQHPNVVTVYAHDVALDCIVMEFLDGTSLASLLERGMDRVNAIRIAIAVAEALAAVHKRGLVHRDIKPENVMLALNQGGSGRFVDWLKLIDFGTALKVNKQPVVLLGTPEFCPPEQFHPEAAVPANDVYALGVTIFLMMTGAYPFEVAREELPRAHHELPVPSLLDTLIQRFGKSAFDPRTHALLEDLGELVQQMLAKAPMDRPSAQEVARRLSRLESSFAEAGTIVAGVGLSAAFLQPVGASPRKKSGTSVLTRAHQPKKAGADDKSSSQTAPDVDRVPSSPQLSSVPSSTAVVPSDRAITDTGRPVLRGSRKVSGSKMPAAAPAPVAPHVVAGPSTNELLPPPRANRGLIIGLVVLVLALVAALVALDVREGQAAGADSPPVPTPTPTPPPTVTKETPPAPEPTPPPEPTVAAPAGPDAGEVASPTDPPAKEPPPPDTGSDAVPLEALPSLSLDGGTPKKVALLRPKEPPCEMDEAFQRSARQKMKALQQGATAAQKDELEDLGDELAATFANKDCRASNRVLKKMQAVVRNGAK